MMDCGSCTDELAIPLEPDQTTRFPKLPANLKHATALPLALTSLTFQTAESGSSMRLAEAGSTWVNMQN